MYDLQTRGKLVKIDQGLQTLVEVIADDVSVAEAFALVDAHEALPGAVHDEDFGGGVFLVGSWSYVIFPPGVDEVYPLDDLFRVLFFMGADDVSCGVDLFSYGPELSSSEGVGFARAVFRDGGPDRPWYPLD